MQFRTILGDDCHVVSCMGRELECKEDFNTSFIFPWHHRCVAILSTAYYWGAFIEAKNKNLKIKKALGLAVQIEKCSKIN